MVNVSAIIGDGLGGGRIVEASFETDKEGLDVEIDLTQSSLFAWHATFGVGFTATADAADGVYEGSVTIKVLTDIGTEYSTVWPYKVNVVAKVDQAHRVYVDTHKNVQFAYTQVPCDQKGEDLACGEGFDMYGDSLYTNWRMMWFEMRRAGYFADHFPVPATQLNDFSSSGTPGAYVVIDPEEPFTSAESEVVEEAVRNGMHLIVAGDWWDRDQINSLNQYYPNYRAKLDYGVYGGSDVAGINVLLKPYSIEMIAQYIDGETKVQIGDSVYAYFDYTTLTKESAEGTTCSASDKDDNLLFVSKVYGKGRVSVMSDSSCIDLGRCHYLVPALLNMKTTDECPLLKREA